MAKEMEVKVLNIDVEDIKKKLNKIGAELVKKEKQVNIVLESDSCEFDEDGGYVRIRENNDLLKGETKYIFTLKKNISRDGLRHNEEIETEVEDAENLLIILKHLGVKEKHRGFKYRESYKYNDILFEIDTWNKETYPKPYLELEVIREEDMTFAKELLNLKEEDITTKSITELRIEAGLDEF